MLFSQEFIADLAGTLRFVQIDSAGEAYLHEKIPAGTEVDIGLEILTFRYDYGRE